MSRVTRIRRLKHVKETLTHNERHQLIPQNVTLSEITDRDILGHGDVPLHVATRTTEFQFERKDICYFMGEGQIS